MFSPTRAMKKYVSLFLALIFTLTFGNLPSISAADDSAKKSNAEAPLDWRMTGPFGGDVRSLVVDPNNADRLYFGTLDGQIYTSTDGAQTWLRLSGFNHPGLSIEGLLVDPRDSKVIYAAGYIHKTTGGFFKSTDGGKTWREAPDLKGHDITTITQSASNPDMLLAGSSAGIYRSLDAGETWMQISSTTTPQKIASLAIDPRDPNVIYAGTWYLPYKTTNGGETWDVTKKGIIDDTDVFAIEIDRRNPSHIIASACSGIYETKNAGETWRKVQGIPSQSRRTRAIRQNPARPNQIYAGTTEGFWRSETGGDEWRLTTPRSLEINAIAVHPDKPDVVYIGTSNYGVLVSRDGGKSFAPSNEGYSGRRAYAIVQDRERPERIYAATLNTALGGGFFFTSDDGGMTWQPATRNMPLRLETYSILQDRYNANIIYLGTNYGLYRSTDRGASWSPVSVSAAPAKTRRATTTARGTARRRAALTNDGRMNVEDSSFAVPKLRLAAMSWSPQQSRRRRTTSNRDTASQDAPQTNARTHRASTSVSSKTLKQIQENLNSNGYDVGTPTGTMTARTVAAIKKYQADRNLPVTGRLDPATLTSLGYASEVRNSAKSGGTAKTLVPITFGIRELAFDYNAPEGKTVLLAATEQGLYRSADPTKGWERISYGEGRDARTLCISTNEQSPKTIWVGTSTSGVLVSRDGGATWEKAVLDPNEPIVPINTIVQEARHPERLYVGTMQTFYLSRDDGQTWQRRGGGLPYGNFTSIIVNPQNSNEIYAGSAFEVGGVFHSMDAGETWERVDPQLPSRRVWALMFDARDPSKIFVGSHSAGVYIAQRNDARASTTGK
jgi:photosystem II stability/assembly factor-like uncharacterized protein